MIVVAAGPAYAQALYVTWPAEVEAVEGRALTLEWSAGGAETVIVALHGTRTSLGGRPRGEFSLLVGKLAAAEGKISLTVPWIDSLAFALKVKAYDGTGGMLGIEERQYRFRPGVLADRTEDGIYLDLRLRENQRLYVQKNQELTHAYLSTSSAAYNWVYTERSPRKFHDHAGVCKVVSKSRSHWSSQFEVRMLWAIRYHEGHFIHATTRDQYRLLGQPASHGCNRLAINDAKQLYEMTDIGTRVEIIGPEKEAEDVEDSPAPAS